MKGSRTGLALGGYGVFGLSPRLGAVVELLFVQAGCRRDATITIDGVFVGTLATTTTVSYLEVPIQLRYALHETETGSAFLSAGPSVGLKTGATFDMEASREAGPMPGTMKESVDVSGFVKDTNFSLVAGAGYTFRRGTLWLTLEARYALGLIDVMERIGRIIVEPDDDDYLLLDKAKPRTFLITLGVGRRPGGE
jgi:hypothetical protein